MKPPISLSARAAPDNSSGPVGFRGNRKASFAASTYEAGSRTVEATFSSGARVRRYFGMEELAITPDAIDLARINAGVCPLLDSHNQGGVAAAIGTVESARIERGQLIGRIRFAETDAGRAAEGMVARGEIASVSIGYQVRTWRLVEESDAEMDVWRAEQWELFEVSLVAVPADPGATIRSADLTEEEADMLTRNAPPADLAPVQSPVTARAIATAARNAGLDAAAVDEMLGTHEASPFTREGLTAEIGRRYAGRDTPAPTQNRVSPFGVSARSEPISGRMQNAIYARMSGAAPSDDAREFMGASMIDLARTLMLENGHADARYASASQIAERAMHTTSDFPNLLLGAGNRYLIDMFQAAGSAIKAVSRQRTAADFRDIAALQLSGIGTLEKVNEAGEFKYGTFSEGKETYRLATFGKIFSITRQAMINDDLGAFSDPLRLMARAAAETEASELAALLNANSGLGPTMSDAVALFHANHNNLAGAGTLISTTSLGAARAAMRNQKDKDGVTFVNPVPQTLLVGTANETLAEQVLTLIAATKTSDVNPFQGKLNLEVDPRLTGTIWRLFADPAQFPVVEYSYLNGAVGPQLSTREGWSVAGMEFRVMLDFGCGVVDSRGAYANPGA